MKNAFADTHPVVNLVYFLLVIGLGMFCMHPVCLGLSLACAVVCAGFLRPKPGKLLLGVLPLVGLTALGNPLFSHEGVTVLCYLPGGNPLTLESVCYGLAAGTMLAAVVVWFSCCNAVITADKFVYLFGRLAPALSLVLSMTLGFIPRFLEKFQEAGQAQAALGNPPPTRRARLRAALTQVSILVTWSLENALDTADSMRSRGYGLKGRTAFSIYAWTRRDILLLLWLICAGGYVLVGVALGGVSWTYYPAMAGSFGGYSGTVFVLYAALCLTPAAFGLWEEHRWRCLMSNI